MRHFPDLSPRTGAFLLALSGVLSLSGGCDPEPDPRYASPEATVATLLEAFECQDASQEEIRDRLAVGDRFELDDAASFHGAFVDYRGTVDEGLAGYVFGFVATGKDDLTVERAGARAYAYPKPSDRSRRVVFLETERHWLIALAESVPQPIQVALRAEHARAREELARAPVPR